MLLLIVDHQHKARGVQRLKTYLDGEFTLSDGVLGQCTLLLVAPLLLATEIGNKSGLSKVLTQERSPHTF